MVLKVYFKNGWNGQIPKIPVDAEYVFFMISQQIEVDELR